MSNGTSGDDRCGLRIVCPICGNAGERDGAWLYHDSTPFRLVEDVRRSWPFEPKRCDDGGMLAVVDAASDRIDWQNGANRRLACMACLGEFPIGQECQIAFE